MKKQHLTIDVQLSIRDARTARSMTQTDLGRLLGLNLAVISFVETGLLAVPKAHRPKWAYALGTTEAHIQWDE